MDGKLFNQNSVKCYDITKVAKLEGVRLRVTPGGRIEFVNCRLYLVPVKIPGSFESFNLLMMLFGHNTR
jgi:hypothetical protein